jgi:hypothetical protein
MTPRQVPLSQPAHQNAVFARIQIRLDEIVEKQKGANDDKQVQREEDRNRRDHV